MSFPVVFIVAVSQFDSIGFRRNTILCVMFNDVFPVIQGAVGFIRQNSTSGNLQLIQAFLQHYSIMHLSAGQFQHKRIPQPIHYCMDFGGSSYSTDPNTLMIIMSRSPFFAPALARCALI